MTVYLSDDGKWFYFQFRNVDYSVRVIGHEFTTDSVDALEERLLEITGSREYVPDFGWPSE